MKKRTHRELDGHDDGVEAGALPHADHEQGW